ncbi:MAG: tetratricopeptide repeat protein [Gemmatimonadaceae bacterium]
MCLSRRTRLTTAIATGALLALPAARLFAQAPPTDPATMHADSLYTARQYAAAAAAYRAILKEHATSARSWTRLGVSLQSLGKFDEAVDAYRHAVTIAPSNAVIAYNLAAAHARLHHSDSAFTWLRTSLRSGFTNTSLLAADSDFVSIRADARYDSILVAGREAMRPCMHRPESRKFDFWVGEWDVQNVNGQRAGSSSVKLILEGCVVFENWTDGQTGEGKSLNAFNATTGQWQQFWTDQYGTVTEYRESKWIADTLQYTADSRTPAGAPALVHMSFAPVRADVVRQWGSISTDAGKTWTPSFDLYYHRKKQ